MQEFHGAKSKPEGTSSTKSSVEGLLVESSSSDDDRGRRQKDQKRSGKRKSTTISSKCQTKGKTSKKTFENTEIHQQTSHQSTVQCRSSPEMTNPNNNETTDRDAFTFPEENSNQLPQISCTKSKWLTENQTIVHSDETILQQKAAGAIKPNDVACIDPMTEHIAGNKDTTNACHHRDTADDLEDSYAYKTPATLAKRHPRSRDWGHNETSRSIPISSKPPMPEDGALENMGSILCSCENMAPINLSMKSEDGKHMSSSRNTSKEPGSVMLL